VVTRWIVASASGSLQSVRIPSVGELGEAAADARAGDVRIDMLRRPGDWVRPPLDNADRIGCVMVRAPTQALAERRAEALVTMSRVEVAAAAALPVDPCEAEPA